MKRMVEGTHTGFLKQITGKLVRQREYGTWFTAEAEEVWEADGTKSATIYIGLRQGAVVQWMVLWPLFEF